MKKVSLILSISILFNLSLSAQECFSVNEKTFKDIQKKIKKAKTDDSRLLISENYVLGNCFTSKQIGVLLTQFDSDNLRAKFLKKYLYTITDPDHIFMAFNSFDDMAMILSTYEQLRPSILSELNPGLAKVESIAMNDSEFDEKFSFVQAEQYTRDKQERIRYFFEFESLTLDQIDSLVKEFKYTRDQKWVLKLLYARCAEKDRYYRFASIFQYERDREELLAFIN